MRNIAYRRVSTGGQDLKRQLFECEIKFDLEFSDKLSGKNTYRPSLQKMMSELQEGDTIHVHSIDRLARSLQDLQKLIKDVTEKGAKLKFYKEGLELGGKMNPMDKLIMQLLGSISEFERNIIVERVKEGVKAAKSEGTQFGAANEKYKKEKHVSKTNHKKTQEMWEAKRDNVQGILNVMKEKKTFSNIAKNFEAFGLKNASGKVKWSGTQAQRVLEHLNISR